MSPIIAVLASVIFSQVIGGPYSEPQCSPGRETIVHLFEWKWTDIKAECERFLGPYGYCGVQISPPSECAVIHNKTNQPFDRPWWERYQPVSYNLISRSGNEQQFRDMVTTCNKVGIRIYVDIVINHMTGPDSGTGTAGNHYDGRNCDFPGVPYDSSDCNNCNTTDGCIQSDDKYQLRDCKLLCLSDLRLSKEYVRSTIAVYLNHLIDIGVAGFRVDAAKHMWPGDLENIFARLHNLKSDDFGSGKKPFIYHEIIDMGGETVAMSEYFGIGRSTDFVYGLKLADIFLRNSDQAKRLCNWGEDWGMPSTNDVVVFLSNHDNQRGHGNGGSPLTFWDPKQLRIGTAFMLAHPYGFPRFISSFRWNRNFQNGHDINDGEGPPHNSDMSIQDVQINADMSCGGGWVCEHRWRQVYNMVAFRNVVAGTAVTNFHSYGDQQISFSRGDKGFIAIVGDNSSLDHNINTGLPSGSYCDVISGIYENGTCTGNSILVDGSGLAHISIKGTSDDSVVAIHVGAKVGSPKKFTT